jgi:hypothetical protein
MSKIKLLTLIFISILSLFSQNIYAQQNNDEGLDQVCGLASGKWHTSASGWACCWSNWGCYGCTGGNCVMKCDTTRCRKANGMSRIVGEGKREFVELNDLAPQGKKAPIIPKPKGKIHPSKNRPSKSQSTETHESGEMQDHH